MSTQIGLTCLGGGYPECLKNSIIEQNPPLVKPRNNAPNHNRYFMEQKRNRSLINGYWNAAGVQFIPAPWLQPTNQESQTFGLRCLNVWKIFCSILKMATTGLLPVWVPMVHTSVHIWYIFVHKMDRSGGFLLNLVRPYCCCAWVSRSKRGRRYGSDSTQIRTHGVTCDGHWKLRYQETENTDIFKITGGLVT